MRFEPDIWGGLHVLCQGHQATCFSRHGLSASIQVENGHSWTLNASEASTQSIMEVRGNLLDFFRMHPWPSGTAWDYHIPFSLEAALSSDNFISVKRAINDVASHSGTKQDDIVISIARETPDHVSQRRPSAWNQHPDSKESYPISFPWASRAPSIRPGMDGRISGQRSRPPST